MVFAWQPVQIDFVGGCMLWFLPEAISSWLTRGLCSVVFAWQPVQIDSLGGCMLYFLLRNQFKLTHKQVVFYCFCLATSLNLLPWRLHVVVFTWQPVYIDSKGGCMLWFLRSNQFKLTHLEAACCGFCLATSSNWLTRRLRNAVFAWQPVQIDSPGGCMLWFLLGNQFNLIY